MAHFAQLDDNNNVVQVVVISNDDLLDDAGNEQEALGLAVCRSIFGAETNWVQTSYNNNFRVRFAGIGMKYQPEADLFYSPDSPFPSWSLDELYDWQPPTPKPEDGKLYYWDEPTLAWVEVTVPK